MDRISDLPDLVKDKILSFLPTKNAVAASILSTKWKNASPFHTRPINLTFDDALILYEEKNENALLDFITGSRKGRSVKFVEFLGRVLSCVSSADSIKINCKRVYPDIAIEKFVKAGVELHINCLVMSLAHISCILLFKYLNGSTTLIRVELEGSFDLRIPGNFELPSLKKLSLSKLRFCNKSLGNEDTYMGSINELLVGCPLLESLQLGFFNMGLLESLNIDSPCLKELIIINNEWQAAGELLVEARGLEVLKCSGAFARTCSTHDFRSLVHADIRSVPLVSMIKNDTTRLVNACSSTIGMCLRENTTQALHESSVSLATFENLTLLELYQPGLNILAHFLCGSPKLKELIIEKGLGNSGGGYAEFLASLAAGQPIVINLTDIKFGLNEMNLKEDEINLLAYFLESGEALRKLTVYSDQEVESVVARLRTLPNQSKVFYCKEIERIRMMTYDFDLALN